ncbi:MAG TPA: hydrogenase maturation nickel metallochaperone HypA [Desulfosporosinus sp.]|nr:hydrogenase maturation nickel metallochaperone HypA [Desulfosporosinus sp.]
MHELGIIAQVVKVAQRTAKANHLTKVNKIVVQVGELSGAIPEYVKKAFPAVVYNTTMKDCQLEIEEIPGIASCQNCGQQYRVVEFEGKCPQCQSEKYNIISGTQLVIKEIVAS